VSAPAVAASAPAPAVAATPAAALLTEELGALDHARAALVYGEGRRTLDELDAYDRRFPSGRLQIEAEVCFVQQAPRASECVAGLQFVQSSAETVEMLGLVIDSLAEVS